MSQLEQVAEQTGLCVGLTVDLSADVAERWIATLGLDLLAAGSTPDEALDAALTEWHIWRDGVVADRMGPHGAQPSRVWRL